MKPLGFGQITGIDIQGESRGILPSQEWKRNAYKRPEQQKWYAGETISLGIGQGYNTFTMLQLAQATAIVANNGIKHRRRLVIATQDAADGARSPVAPARTAGSGLQARERVAVIRKALVAVTRRARRRGCSPARRTSVWRQDRDRAGGHHRRQRTSTTPPSWRSTSATMPCTWPMHPAEAPTIALAVVVENAGFGAAHAAPIARRVFDYWLLSQYPSEEDLAAVQKGLAAAPLGKPRQAAEVSWPPAGQPAPSTPVTSP
jgi:penicillin-binding protein 2